MSNTVSTFLEKGPLLSVKREDGCFFFNRNKYKYNHFEFFFPPLLLWGKLGIIKGAKNLHTLLVNFCVYTVYGCSKWQNETDILQEIGEKREEGGQSGTSHKISNQSVTKNVARTEDDELSVTHTCCIVQCKIRL